MMGDFETTIGLEVHLQLKTNSKIFCSCSTEFESPPNTNICPICCGYPGVLPVFNKKVLELAIRVSLALNCRINKKIYFERKNYFYPDLPKNYQISQYKMPLGEDGFLDLDENRSVRIKRVHLEEDAGKLIHKESYSLVDFNRCGIPLLEIVSYPEIKSPQEAFDYLSSLKLVLQYIGASSCDMEKGTLRCDANISLKKKDVEQLGTKVELKNMNSFKGVKDALSFEVKRQSRVLKNGQRLFQETRLWDAEILATTAMRSKEEAHDYRYFPEPDLLDFSIAKESIENERALVGELPLARKQRFLEEYKLTEAEIDILISHKWLADFFEEAHKVFNQAKKISNWLLGPFLEQVNSLPDKFKGVNLSAQNFAKIVQYFCEGKLNNLAAKKVLSLSVTTNEDIDKIIEKEGLLQVSSEAQLDKFVEEVIKENEKAVKEYLEGKSEVIMFLVGQLMRKTEGKANPQLARQLLEKALNRDS